MSDDPRTSSTTVDAAGEYMAAIFQAPKTGNISKIGYFAATATGSPAVDVRLETVAGTGLPSGSLKGTNTNGSSSPLSNTWNWVTLTSAAAVTKGDYLAAKVLYSSGTSLLINHWEANTNAPSALAFPYSARNTGSPGKTTFFPAFAVQYDDGSIPFTGMLPFSNTTLSQNINSGSTPDEKGIKFTVPFSCKCVGAAFRQDSSATTFTVKLYDGSNTLLESVASIDSEFSVSTGGEVIALWDTEVTLTVGATYRLTLLPDAGTNIIIYRATVDASATREAWPGGTAFQSTERTDAGAWTDTATEIPFISLLLSALDDGAGGGGGGGIGRLAGGALAQ